MLNLINIILLQILASQFILANPDIKAQSRSPEILGNGADSIFIDSIFIQGFRFDEYYYPNLKNDPGGRSYLVYRDNKLLFKSPPCQRPHIFPCTLGDMPCTFLDINGDGFKEIVIVCYLGGNAGNTDAYIYSVNNPTKLIAALADDEKGEFSLSDCERDGFPEPTFGDLNYHCWHYGCSGSPRPYLVWKWDGIRYKLANFKLGYLFLKNELNIDVKYLDWDEFINDDFKVTKYDPEDEYRYPVELLRTMLNFIYFGYSNYADTLFNRVWPDSVANKKLFYDDLWQKINSDPYWAKLQKSNW